MKWFILPIFLLLISCSNDELKVGDCFVEKGNFKDYYEQNGFHKIRSITESSYYTFFYSKDKWSKKGQLKKNRPAWNISLVPKGLNEIVKVGCMNEAAEIKGFVEAVEQEKKEHKKYYSESWE